MVVKIVVLEIVILTAQEAVAQDVKMVVILLVKAGVKEIVQIIAMGVQVPVMVSVKEIVNLDAQVNALGLAVVNAQEAVEQLLKRVLLC